LSISANNSQQLDLSVAPSVLFLFGLAGSGKTFVGELLGRLSGRYVYEADQDLTPAMTGAIATGAPFTDAMRDEFFLIVATRINELRRAHRNLIVTQATYKQRHRDLIKAQVEHAAFIHITALDSIVIERLISRGDNITPEYATVMRANFEAPSSDCPTISNNGTAEEIIRQVALLYPPSGA
jgi:gluconokinase